MSPGFERKRPGGDSHLVRRPEPISTGGSTGASAQPASAAAPGAALPEPYEATGTGELSPNERDDLAVCEAAVDNLRIAFAAAGKALQVIRDGGLYRDTHTTFEEYLHARWDMSRAQAYRLIESWPLAQKLSPMGDTVNERQIREILPVADRHGQDAAVAVYRAVAEAPGVQVTATLLRGAVRVLPHDHFDSAQAVSQIRAYLASAPNGPAASSNSQPVQVVTNEAGKFLRAWQKAASSGTLKAAASQNPDAVRRLIADLRALLDEVEQETL